MHRQQRMYRHILRSVAAGAALLVFLSALTTEPVQDKTYESTALLANAVGMFVGVAPNPDNTKAAALAAKEAELAAREGALGNARSAEDTSAYDLLSIVALAVSSLVLLLVMLNFYFDRLNTLEQRRGPYTHS